jgi:hypothetical protein
MTTALIRSAALLGAIILSSGSALVPAGAAADATPVPFGNGALGWPDHGVWKVVGAPQQGPIPSTCMIEPLGVGGAMHDDTLRYPILSFVYNNVVVRFVITDFKADPKITKKLSLNIDGKNFGPYGIDFMTPPSPSVPSGLGVTIPSLEQNDVFSALKFASSLEVKSENSSWEFDPKGIDGAIDDLFSCERLLH